MVCNRDRGVTGCRLDDMRWAHRVRDAACRIYEQASHNARRAGEMLVVHFKDEAPSRLGEIFKKWWTRMKEEGSVEDRAPEWCSMKRTERDAEGDCQRNCWRY